MKHRTPGILSALALAFVSLACLGGPAAVAAPTSGTAGPLPDHPGIFATAPDGSLVELVPLSERDLEIVMSSLSTAIAQGQVPTVRPDTRIFIQAPGLTPAHFLTGPGSLHDGFRFATASVVTEQREWGLTPSARTLTDPPAVLGELLLIARDGATPDQDLGYLAAVSETGAVRDATALSGIENSAREEVVQRVRSDMRSMATALEAYAVDCRAYPPSAPAGSPDNVNAADPLMSQRPGFAPAPGFVLTTPIAYISSVPADPFASTPHAVFAYVNLAPNDPLRQVFGQWALMSPGPDRLWDLDLDEGTEEEVKAALFDPTNGAMSRGDIVRSQIFVGR
jgi:hypothetical protein